MLAATGGIDLFCFGPARFGVIVVAQNVKNSAATTATGVTSIGCDDGSAAESGTVAREISEAETARNEEVTSYEVASDIYSLPAPVIRRLVTCLTVYTQLLENVATLCEQSS